MEITCKGCDRKYIENDKNKPASKCNNCGTNNPIPIPKPDPDPPKPKPKPEPDLRKPEPPQEVGWLVVHDEQAATQTYPLRMGAQVIGRKNTTRPCDIQIQTNDLYMSRRHCEIEVKRISATQLQYLLKELEETNGTFVNSDPKPLSPTDLIVLNDGYVIQMGETKVVFKTPQTVQNADQATYKVKGQKHAPTIRIKK